MQRNLPRGAAIGHFPDNESCNGRTKPTEKPNPGASGSIQAKSQHIKRLAIIGSWQDPQNEHQQSNNADCCHQLNHWPRNGRAEIFDLLDARVIVFRQSIEDFGNRTSLLTDVDKISKQGRE